MVQDLGPTSTLVNRNENIREKRILQEPPSCIDGGRGPETEATYNELTHLVHDNLLERCLDDPDLTNVFDLLESRGEYTAGELATEFNLTTNEARALRRRFSRALDRAITAAVSEDRDD